MFPHVFKEHHVGSNNVHWVMQQLKQHRISVVNQCLGGEGYRKVAWTVGMDEPTVDVVYAQTGAGNGR
jgi:chemotaxis receptor (MCP) glutamine deamidase CheD